MPKNLPESTSLWLLHQYLSIAHKKWKWALSSPVHFNSWFDGLLHLFLAHDMGIEVLAKKATVMRPQNTFFLSKKSFVQSFQFENVACSKGSNCLVLGSVGRSFICCNRVLTTPIVQYDLCILHILNFLSVLLCSCALLCSLANSTIGSAWLLRGKMSLLSWMLQGECILHNPVVFSLIY